MGPLCQRHWRGAELPDYVTQYRRRNDIDLKEICPWQNITEEMDMADDREFSNVYTIPPNYTDSGKLLGGLLETRNTVEACILLLLWAIRN